MVATDGTPTIRRAQTLLFWASVWLAVVLVGIKASYLGWPGTPAIPVNGSYLRSLAAISYLDVVFAALVWAAGLLPLLISRGRPKLMRAVSVTAVAFSAVFCFYAVVNVLLFGILGGFITYSLFQLIGNVRMLSSSVNAHLTLWNSLAMAGVPLVYVALVYAAARFSARAQHVSPARNARAHRRARCRGRMDRRRTTHLRERMGQPAGAPHRRESALGPGLVLVRRNARRGHRADDRAVPRCRPGRLRSAGRQAGVAAEGSPHVRFGAASADKGRPAAKRDRHRAGISRGAMDQPQQSVRHHAAPQGRSSARADLRQRLCAHRPQLELAGGDAALGLPQTRLPRSHRGADRSHGHIAPGHLSIAGVSDRVLHAERPAMG